MTLTTTKSQMIIRNSKMFWFFPDVTIDDLTKGFLVDIGSPIAAEMQALWNEYCGTDKTTYFSVYINIKLVDAKVYDYVYSMYHSLPSSQGNVVGMAVPRQSVIVRKRRLTSL